MKQNHSLVRRWSFFASSVMLFVGAQLCLPCDYAAGAFTGRVTVTVGYVLRHLVPYALLLVTLLLCPVVSRKKLSPRLLPIALLAGLFVLSGLNMGAVVRSGQWLFCPPHSYLIGAILSDSFPIYTLLSILLVVWAVGALPGGSALLHRGFAWGFSAVYGASLLLEIFLQAAAGARYFSVLFALASAVFYFLSVAELSSLLTPENSLWRK